MNKRAIKYIHQKGATTSSSPTEREIYLDPYSKAYELYKDNKIDELVKHLDLCLIAESKWRR